MCSVGVLWRCESPNAEAALGRRGEFLDSLRTHSGWPVDIASAAVIYSELVSNVVKHAPGPVKIHLSCHDREIVARVEDLGPLFILDPSLPTDPQSFSGRGLFIVASYAKKLWLESDPPWKSLSVVL